MEVMGMPSEELISKSRKKGHYFDTDFSPFLIEDPNLGILHIPDSRPLNIAVPTTDLLLLDFIRNCLQLDPEYRFSAS